VKCVSNLVNLLGKEKARIILIPILIAFISLCGDFMFEEPNIAFATTVNKTAISTAQNDIITLAKQFVSDMAESNKNAALNFDTTMKAQLSEVKLQEIWKGVISQYGKYNEQVGTRSKKNGVYDIIYVTTLFDNNLLDIKVVFNSNKQIAGLFFMPSTMTKEQLNSTNNKNINYVEQNVTIGSGEWKLSGTLTLPKGKGPFPVLILVHGSGPNDRDESIGPNKPFKDIAASLSSKGIAVLRYDKRTKVYGSRMASNTRLTIKEETIDDAVVAIKLMKTTKGIDKKRIFILGHSLGGNQIPRIANQAKDAAVAGYIILAGNVRPLEDLILEQTEYILSLDKALDINQARNQINLVNNQVLNIKKLKKDTKLTPNQLLGVPASYWLDLRGYSPAVLAREIKQPLLILQGERDYQVTVKDFALWKKQLAGKRNTTFINYKNLNHLFMTGKGKSTPQEYNVSGHVSENVINDIDKWIKSK
jgi:dienelactone hydrolase